MVSNDDVHNSAKAIRCQFGDQAETHAIEKMQEFMDQGDVVLASVWLMIAQEISRLEQEVLTRKIH